MESPIRNMDGRSMKANGEETSLKGAGYFMKVEKKYIKDNL